MRSDRVAAILLALACATPCEAGVFAIGDDGAFVPVAGVDAPQLVRLVASRDPLPATIQPQAVTTLASANIPASFAAVTRSAATANDVSPDLLAAVVWQESRWHPDAVSSAGAVGLAQLMPSTARGMRVNPRHPVANLYGAAHYLREQIDRFDGNVELALAAYNAGPARVRKAGGVPAIAETRTYVSAVMDRLSAMPNKEN